MAEPIYSFDVSLQATTGSDKAAIRLPFTSSVSISTSRGLNMAVLDCHNGKCIKFYNFDIVNEGATAWDNFAARIETYALSINLFIIIAVEQGRPGLLNSITVRARRALQCLGGTGFDSLKDSSAVATWGLVGQKGSAAGTAEEKVGTGSLELSASLAAMTGPCRAVGMRATSNGSTSAWIVLDDTIVVSGGSNGINVAILDPSSTTIDRVATFDINAAPSNGDTFADLIDALSLDTIVAVTFKDLQPSKLSNRAKRALEDLGSVVVTGDIPSSNASWVLVGSKYLGSAGVSEVLAIGRSAQTDFYFSPTHHQHPNVAYTLQVRGSFGGDLDICVDGVIIRSAIADAQHTLRIAAVSPDTGLVEGFRALNVSNDNDMTALRAFVELIPPGYQVAVICQIPAGSIIPSTVVDVLSYVGALQVQTIGDSNMYGLVGYKGANPGRAFDRVVTNSGLSNAADNFAITCHVTSRDPRPVVVVETFSTGYESGNRGHVIINMRTVLFVPVAGSSQYRGINVVVFDGKGHIANIASFDTHGDAGASDKFATLIGGLPNHMRVALVVVDEATNKLSERGKNAIKSLGGTKIDSLEYRGSYALVGCKGRGAGFVAESVASRTAKGAQAKSFEPSVEPKLANPGNWLSISSSSTSSNNILLDGKPIQAVIPNSIQVLLVGEKHPVVFNVNDDSSLDAVLESIRLRVPDPKTVYAMYVPPVPRLYPTAARIGRLIGSMWAGVLRNDGGLLVIGVPGSSPGSALELKVGGPETTTSLWTGFITHVKTDSTVATREPRSLILAFIGAVVVGIVGIIWLQRRADDEVAAPLPHYQQLTTVSTLPIDPIPPSGSFRDIKRRAVFVAIDYHGVGEGVPNQFSGAARRHMIKAQKAYINKRMIKDQLDTRFLDDDPQTPNDKRASATNIFLALEWLVKETKDNEVALFHIFSHGLKGSALIAASNSSDTPRNTTLITANNLRAKIANISRKVNFTFVFNACHSGKVLGDTNVERGISIAAAREEDAAWFNPKSGGSVTSFLTTKVTRSVNEKKPLPTYTEMRTYLENEMKNEYDHKRSARPDLPEIHIVLQCNNGITNPDVLRWLDGL